VGAAKKMTEGEKAHKLAQERAALPIDQGGLGLPKNNTAEQRAEAMGFVDEGYHGSLYDIKRFLENRASTESHVGRGTYITDSPRDASINYADIYGPDVVGKIENALDRIADEKDIIRFARRFRDKKLTQRQAEILLANTIGAENLGVVYPLRYRANKPVHLDRPQSPETTIGPFNKYEEELEDYIETPAASDLNRALREYREMGGDESKVVDELVDYFGEAIPADKVYRAVHEASGRSSLMDPDTGDIVSSGVAAGDFLRNFGVDEISHTPNFASPQLNLGTRHTVAMNPENIRSRFAAFDPWRVNAATAAAMGVAAPDLMASEKKSGGKVQKKHVGGRLFKYAAGGRLFKYAAEIPAKLRKPEMFIGEKSAVWNAGAASEAAKLEKEGASPAQIWQQTKTFKGPDGKWRQEISDQPATFLNRADLQAKAQQMYESEQAGKEAIAKSKLERDLFPKQLTAAQKELRQKIKASKEERTGLHGPETSPEFMGNYAKWSIEHPELYAAYPELADIVVKQGGGMPGHLGALIGDRGSKYMDIYSSALRDDPRSTALHEMQHAVQHIEGWAPGGNLVTAFRDPLAWDIYRDLKNRALQPLSYEEFVSRHPFLPEGGEAQAYEKYKKEIPSIVEKLDRELQSDAAKQYYRRLAGEAEARATQARKDMGSAERAQTFPGESFDVPFERQIVKPPLKKGGKVSQDAMNMAVWGKAQRKAYEEMVKSLTGKKKGGKVEQKAEGGITSDDLIVEERPL
jgi:hypothetical protein